MLLLLLLFSKPFAMILLAALTGWTLFRYRFGRVKNNAAEETAR
jgi:GH25 family lysozyme M1 (1,4-beta-N-acetylmuramidase)